MADKTTNLETCDALLAQAEELESGIHGLIRALPPGVASTGEFLAKTANTAHVVVEKLNTAYNLIRRYDHA